VIDSSVVRQGSCKAEERVLVMTSWDGQEEVGTQNRRSEGRPWRRHGGFSFSSMTPLSTNSL